MNHLLMETLIIGVGTYGIRAGSLSVGSRIVWPEWARAWLSYVTPAVLGALLGPALLLSHHHFIPISHNALLICAVPTLVVAWFSRNLLGTVATGVVAYALVSRMLV